MISSVSSTRAVSLSIVVPGYNEAENIAPVVAEILQVLNENSWVGSCEILLVDDGSRDETGTIMDRLAGDHSEIRVFHHQNNRGFGAALKTGFAASTGRNVTLITADGEVGPDQVVALLREIGDADLIVGRRERKVSLYRQTLTFGLNILIRLVLGFVPDETLVYVVRGDLLRRMDLQSDTGLVNLEVVLYCRHWRCRIRSGVAHARPRLSGSSKVTNAQTMWRTFVEMVKLGRSLRARRSSDDSSTTAS